MAKKQNMWTDEEIKLLKGSSKKNIDELQLLFPSRTIKSIIHKITNMGLPRQKQYDRYSKEEDAILVENSEKSQEILMTLLPNRTWESITYRIDTLNLPRHKAWAFWSEEEVNLLRNCSSVEDAINKFPYRSVDSVKNKIYDIGLKFKEWSDEDIKYLIMHYPMNESKKIAANLSKSLISVYQKAYDLNLKKDYSKYSRYALSGSQHPNWKGGVTSENNKVRKSVEFKTWRLSVYERDNYTCQCCGDSTGGNLHAHHIENFAENVEKRFDIDNGITLCNDCHNPVIEGSFHHTYGTRNNNREQLQEYIKSKQLLLV